MIRQATDRLIAERRQGDWKENWMALAGCLPDKTDRPDFEAIRSEGDRL